MLKKITKMKKIFTFGAIALAALLTLGCKQELSVDVQPADNLFYIYATRENPLTKTSWTPDANDYSIAWGAKDYLSVFATDDPNPVEQHNLYFYSTADAYTAYWEGGWKSLAFTHGSAEIPGTAPYTAVFPYDRSNLMDAGHPQIPFKYEQIASDGFFDSKAYAAVANSDNLNFSFKNVFGLLAIKVGDANVTSVKLKNKSEGDGFQSRYTIAFIEGIPYCIPSAGVAVPEITLSASEGSFVVNHTYYMVVPEKDFTEGAVFSLYHGDDLLGTITTAPGVSVDRAKVHFVPTLTLGEQPPVEESANATINFPDLGYENGEEIVKIFTEDVALVADKGTGSNVPKYYTDGTAGRFYGGNTIALNSNKKITRVEFTFSDSETAEGNPNQILVMSNGETEGTPVSNGVWTGSEQYVVFTISGTSKHRRIVKIQVGEGANDTPGVMRYVATPTFDPAAGAVESGTQVTLSCATEGASIYFSLTKDEPSTLYTAPITITEAVTITAVAKKQGMLDSKPATASYTIKETVFTNIAELNAKLTKDAADLNGHLTDAVVSFVPATNTAIIKDATGSITYYKSSHGLKQGQTFSGDLSVKALLYNGLFSEITAMDAEFTGEEKAVDPETVSLATVAGSYSTYQNAYVKVSGLTVTEVSGKNVSVTDGSVKYIVFTNYGNATNVVGQEITAIGTVTKYGETEELKVWKAADIIVDKDVDVPATIEAKDITGIPAGGVTDAVTSIVINHGDGWNAAVTPDGTVVTAASINGNDITYSVSANTGDARDGSITVTLTKGGETDVVKVIKVSQLAAGSTEPQTIIIDGSQLTSDVTTEVSELKYSNLTIVFSSGAKSYSSTGDNKFTDKAILIGKNGAYIYNKTAVPGKITKFEIYSNKNASAKVSVGVNFSSSAIESFSAEASNTYAATLSTVDNVYDCSASLPDNCKYFWYQVTNSNNSQVQFRITYIPE